jgi:hypothetical protein
MVSLLFGPNLLVLLRFRCFLNQIYWFCYGFVAFLTPDLGFTKVSLLFWSRTLVLLRFRCFFPPDIGFTKVSLLFGRNLLVLLRFRYFLDHIYWFHNKEIFSRELRILQVNFPYCFLLKTIRKSPPGSSGSSRSIFLIVSY